MFIAAQYQVYFVDRDNAVFQIDGVSFVSSHDPSRHLIDTLVDGEMVIDTEPGGQTHPRYLIYDFISLEGNQLRKEHFNVRYRMIQVRCFVAVYQTTNSFIRGVEVGSERVHC